MAEHGFTPGPWTHEDRCDVGYVREATPWEHNGDAPMRKAVALVRVIGRTPEENGANARLIAASPTLLEAAIAVSQAAVKRAAWGRDNVPAMRDEQRALADLRAAITLATGKDA